VNTLVDGFACADFPELAPIAVVHVLFAYLLVKLLLFEHVLLLFDLSDDVGSFLIPAQWALDYVVILHLVLCPLTETFQVEGVPTYGRAGCRGIVFYYLHVAYSTEIILVLIFFLDDHISSVHFYFGVLQELLHFIVVDAPISNDVSQFFVVVGVSEQQVVVFG
jgi:hypothetical protein